jgi:hypothetical protein
VRFGIGDSDAQPAVFEHQPPHVERAADAGDQMIGGERFGDEVPRALLERGDRGGNVAVPGHQDDGQLRVARCDRLRHRMAVHARHPDVADDHAGEVGAELRQCGTRVRERLDLDPGDRETVGQRGPQPVVIVDQQHA